MKQFMLIHAVDGDLFIERWFHENMLTELKSRCDEYSLGLAADFMDTADRGMDVNVYDTRNRSMIMVRTR